MLPQQIAERFRYARDRKGNEHDAEGKFADKGGGKKAPAGKSHPLEGKNKEQMMQHLLTESGNSSKSSNPRGYSRDFEPKSVPLPELTAAIETAVKEAKKKNSFDRPSVPDLFDAIKAKHPGLTLTDFQGTVARMLMHRQIQMGAYTQAVGTMTEREMQSVIPLDHDMKMYVDMYQAAGQPRRYSSAECAALVARYSGTEFVTVGGHASGDKKHVGGQAVPVKKLREEREKTQGRHDRPGKEEKPEEKKEPDLPPSWQPGLFGGAKSIAVQSGLFGAKAPLEEPEFGRKKFLPGQGEMNFGEEKGKEGGEQEHLSDKDIFARSGEGFENLQKALGYKKPVMGPEGAERLRKALSKHSGGKVISALLKVDGGETGYDRNGFADRGQDVFRTAIDGKFSEKELKSAAEWLEKEFGGATDRAGVNQFRWLSGTVKTAKPEKHQHPASPVRYSAAQIADLLRYRAEKGRWITLGANKGEGEHHGGVPVYIEDGQIIKGPAALHGKKLSSLGERGEAIGSHRQQMKHGREHAVASLKRKARQAGIEPKALEDMAEQLMAMDSQVKGDRMALLHDARSMSKNMGWGDISNLKTQIAKGHADHKALTGFGNIAESIASRHAGEFLGKDPEERLFEILGEGNPELLSEEDAYQQAFDRLKEGQHDDVVPFQASGKPVRCSADTIARIFADETFLYGRYGPRYVRRMDSEYHGEKPPGEGWAQSGEGPRGGKIWTKGGKQGGESSTLRGNFPGDNAPAKQMQLAQPEPGQEMLRGNFWGDKPAAETGLAPKEAKVTQVAPQGHGKQTQLAPQGKPAASPGAAPTPATTPPDGGGDAQPWKWSWRAMGIGPTDFPWTKRQSPASGAKSPGGPVAPGQPAAAPASQPSLQAQSASAKQQRQQQGQKVQQALGGSVQQRKQALAKSTPQQKASLMQQAGATTDQLAKMAGPAPANPHGYQTYGDWWLDKTARVGRYSASQVAEVFCYAQQAG